MATSTSKTCSPLTRSIRAAKRSARWRKRTKAVAGINGDYFDIGNTNRPENIVVRGGALLQVPYKRYALAITRDGGAHIAEFSFSGELQVNERTLSLGGIDSCRRPTAASRC